MGMGIYVPQKKQSNALQVAGQIAGGVIGAAAGGPAGAVTGMQLGGAAGGLAQGAVNDAPKQAAVAPQQEGSAISRRMQAMQSDRLNELRQSILAVPDLPPEMRQQYAQPLLTAYQAELKNRGQV